LIKVVPSELQSVFDALVNEAGEHYYCYIKIPFKGNPYEIWGIKEKNGNYDRYAIDPKTYNVVSKELHKDKPAAEKLINSIYALHSGQFFGEVGKALWCASSLSMALFGISGVMMFWRRKKKKNAKDAGETAVVN
jgi:uncharacterized iron-regulated membrane protein